MKQHLTIGALIAAVTLSACAASHAPPPAPPAPLSEGALHETRTVISDITDPAHPVELWHGSNVITDCGVRNMMGIMAGRTNMGTAASAGCTGLHTPTYCCTVAGHGCEDTIADRCAGLNEHLDAKVPAGFNVSDTQIAIGAGGPSSCQNGTANPFPCCTGSGNGCDTASSQDVILFAQGQLVGSLVNAGTNYQNWLSGGQPNTSGLSIDSAAAYYYADRLVCTANGVPFSCCTGSGTGTCSHEGVQLVATTNGANHSWCEYGVTTGRGRSGAGAVSGTGATNQTPGWLLNHALISPCLVKTTGTWRITVSIVWK